MLRISIHPWQIEAEHLQARDHANNRGSRDDDGDDEDAIEFPD
jgi:hypothetical protein